VVTPTCGPVCTMFCELGMKTDQRGCPICECMEPTSTAQLEAIFEEFWWAFLIAVIVLIIVIVVVSVVCWYKRRKLEQRERERIAQYCPGDTLLKANSAFHLALQQQTVEYNDETLQAQRRFRDVADFSAGPLEDRETVFDINDFQMEGMKTFFEGSSKPATTSEASTSTTSKETQTPSNKQTQTASPPGTDNRLLPDVVGGSSQLHSLMSEDEESGVHFRSSQTSLDDTIDYHRSRPTTPSKLTEL